MKKLSILSSALILITIVILQSGCLKEFTNNAYPDVTASADTIYGILKHKQTDINGTQIGQWHFGEAVINAVSGGNEVIASAVVEGDGTFMLILPETVSGLYFTSLADIATQQGGTVKATPETVKCLATTQFRVDYTDSGKAKSISVSHTTRNADLSVNRTYYYNFYDLDGTFTGKGISGSVFNWTYSKGWGMVESYITSTAANAINSKSVKNAPANAVWSN
jgi:hypothetical protein